VDEDDLARSETNRHEGGAKHPIDADKLWRALVESSPDIVLIVDTDGTIEFINRVRPPFVGRAVVGAKIWEFGADGAEARIRPILKRIVETREALRYEAPGVPPPGETRSWFEVCAIPLVVDGVVARIIWSAADVTARRTAQETLAFQAALLSQVRQPVIATDGKGLITYWNEAAERLYGWTQAEVLGKDSAVQLQTRFVGPGGREAFLAAIEAESAWHGELGHTTRAGEEIVVDVSVQVRKGEKNQTLAAIAVMKDVTDRKQLEEQLRQSQKLEAIGLLAGGVAHDFNNLLAIIMGFSEVAIRQLPSGHEVASHLETVTEAARRGGELTRKLLAFSRKQIIRSRPVDVGAIAYDLTRLLERVVGADVELSLERGETPLVVQADPVQLEQVLLNLCTNARQAMPNGGKLVLSTRAARIDAAFALKHPWARAGEFAEIVVRDTGVGMNDATRARIFEPFFTTKAEGTGLGLATAYGILKQHDGFIDVESAPGTGTTFRVFLPLASAAVVPPSLERAAPNGEPRGRELILVAEDEPSLRRLVTATLEKLGYRVIAAGDGEAAVEAYRADAGNIALVVLDVVLPRLNARQVYERMREIRPDVKVLFMTGYAPESTGLGALLDEAAIPLLEKPFVPSTLAERVRSAIDSS
jgi:PAS domain S-box-containing protein